MKKWYVPRNSGVSRKDVSAPLWHKLLDAWLPFFLFVSAFYLIKWLNKLGVF